MSVVSDECIYLRSEIARLANLAGEALVRENNLIAALEQLRAWCADKGDLDGELMAQAALTNEAKPQIELTERDVSFVLTAPTKEQGGEMNIIEWLRREAELVALPRLNEAADEIERLREILEWLQHRIRAALADEREKK